MKKLILLGLILLAPLGLHAAQSWSAPATVNSGESYVVSVDAGYAAHTWAYLYKNGSFVGSAEADNYSPAHVDCETTDFGNQVVSFSAYAIYEDWNGNSSDSGSVSVTVIVPNLAPTIAWVVNPEYAAVGEWFNVQARGNDANGNLASVSVFREGQPFALNGGGNGSESYSDLNGASFGSPGNVQFSAYAQDQNGLYSETIYWTVTIYQPNRSPDNATISSDGVTQINLGQSVHLTGTLHDPDGNLAYHNLYCASPSAGGWPALLSGAPSNSSNSTVSTYFTPTEVGTWQFHANGHDGQYWGQGTTLSVNVVDGTAPSIPAGLNSSGATGIQFTLSWSASSDNVGVSLYEVYRGGVSIGTTASTSMVVSGLTQGTTYSMTVRAKDAAGNWSSSSAALPVSTLDTQVPTTPTGLIAGNVTPTSFTLSWSAASDNLGVTAYEVMKGATFLGTTAGVSMGLTGLAQGTTYSMTVRARDAAGNWSEWSHPLVVITSDIQAPSVPGSLTASNITTTSFTLSWSASSDNVGVTAYEVMKGATALTPTSSGLSMSVGSLTPSTTYTMTVRARDAAGNWSPSSAVLNVTTAAPNSTTDTDGDGVPDVIEHQLGTNPNAAKQADSSNQSALQIHRPNP